MYKGFTKDISATIRGVCRDLLGVRAYEPRPHGRPQERHDYRAVDLERLRKDQESEAIKLEMQLAHDERLEAIRQKHQKDHARNGPRVVGSGSTTNENPSLNTHH